MNRTAFYFIIFLIFFTATSLSAKEPSHKNIPRELEGWVPWVLDGDEEMLCPYLYNGNGQRCFWPKVLNLELFPTSGVFSQEWVMDEEGLVPLPGDMLHWPIDVMVDSKPAIVVKKNNLSYVLLQRGKHKIHGKFKWLKLPEILCIPVETGIVNLKISNERILFPKIDKNGRLWLTKQARTEKENSLSMEVFRMIDDNMPMLIITRLILRVSGQAREVNMGKIVLPDSIPLSIKSHIPVKLSKSGHMVIQVRPGEWVIEFTTRQTGKTTELTMPETLPDIWPNSEIWVFNAKNNLRMVKIGGVAPIDANQTNLPYEWLSMSAYIIKAGDKMTLTENRRGDPDPLPNQINMSRTLWMDFDGNGYTVHDHITGKMRQSWHLSMNPSVDIGRITINGVDQLITSSGKKGLPGIELRSGALDIEAESRIKGRFSIPAIGWDHNIQKLSTKLNLPPGWSLFAVSGCDRALRTWVGGWSLLDIFFVLITTIAVYKLWSYKWAIVAFFTLVITNPEPGAPKFIWLFIIAIIALKNVLPDGEIKKIAGFLKASGIVILLIIAVPFMVYLLKTGIYPQLKGYGYQTERSAITQHAKKVEKQKNRMVKTRSAMMGEMQAGVVAYGKKMETGEQKEDYRPERLSKNIQPATVQEHASPDKMDVKRGVLQTGPGLPSWQWTTVMMGWNGPVDKEQDIKLWLIPPFANLFLSFLKVILMALFILRILELKSIKIVSGLKGLVSASFIIFLIMPVYASAQYPSPELLNSLKDRLIKKPDCIPWCADIERMSVIIDNKLMINLKVHAMETTGIPLPGSRDSWLPSSILVDGSNGAVFYDNDGILWLRVSKGIHDVVLSGPAGGNELINLHIHIKPHKFNYSSKTWDIEGLQDDGLPGTNIRLTAKEPVKKSDDGTAVLDKNLPAFSKVTRILRLGYSWHVTTKVKRLSPKGTPIILSIPLLQGESVNTSFVKVKDGNAIINIEPWGDDFIFVSTLEQTPLLKLTAPVTTDFIEEWVLDANSAWHCDIKGIPAVRQQDGHGAWSPKWRPWPGENIEINVKRLEPVPGKWITIDSVKIISIPGKRLIGSTLEMNVKASRGGEQVITLPEGAELQSITIDKRSLPITLQDKKAIIPVEPGTQKVMIKWNQKASSGFITRPPLIDIGEQAVNIEIKIQMPQGRWTLFTHGPLMGPAVLFWGEVIVIFIISLVLGRIRLTPLKALHWFLLLIGMTQVHIIFSIIIAGWLIALGLRQEKKPPENWFTFNCMQLGLVIWGIISLVCLYAAVESGLLNLPDMHIAGNMSTSSMLKWYVDKSAPVMPRPFTISLPLFAYRIIMLAWALWLAASLIKWLKFAWESFKTKGLWRDAPPRKIKPEKEIKEE